MTEIFLLSEAQKEIFGGLNTFSNSSFMNIGTLVYFQDITVEQLTYGLNYLLEKNSQLRSRIYENNGEPYQSIEDVELEKFIVLSFSNKDEISTWANKHVNEFKFNFKEKLYDFYILVLPEGITGIYACFSHLISDAGSISLLINELMDRLLEKENDLIKGGEYRQILEIEKEYKTTSKFAIDKHYLKKLKGKLLRFLDIISIHLVMLIII